jgi:hypothetical protein
MMSMIINNLLYRFNILSKPSDIVLLNKYMLTTENKDTIINNSNSIENVLSSEQPKIEETEEEKQESNIRKEELYQPKQQDTLFWSLYIINYGYNDYLQIDHNYGVKELEEKQKISKFMKENVVRIKNTNYKLTNVAIQEVLSELLTSQKETSLLCLIVMIVYYNINILIINENTKCMLEFWCNKDRIPSTNSSSEESDALTYVLYKTDNGKYKLQYENIGSFQINDLKEKYVVLESYNKYIKAISNYKVEELEDIAKKFGVFDETKKYKKAELYELVGNNCKF